MSIRFRCTQCNVLLSISSRKAGSEVTCPKCSSAQAVPLADPADEKPKKDRAAGSSAPAVSAAAPANGEPDPAVKREPAARSAKPAVKTPDGLADEKRASAAAPSPAAAKEPAPKEPVEPDSPTATGDDAKPLPKPVAADAAKTQSKHDSPGVITVYDELIDDELAATATPKAEPVAAPPSREAPAPPKQEAASADVPVAPPPAPPPMTVPGGMILYRRNTLYVHAILFVLLAGASYATGYWIGRGDATLQLQVQQEQAGRERVLVEGLVLWSPNATVVNGDENAVIIALPEGKTFDPPIPMPGLRPVDPAPTEFNRGVRAIKDAGGDYTRAGPDGKFAIVVPDRGRYRILVISRNARRGENDSLDEEIQFNEISRYFQLAESLVGRSKFRWTLEEIKPGFNPIEVSFGEDGK